SQEIQKQKKAHWKDFLNDPNNIWKANAYTKLANAGTTIPTLATSEGVARKDEEKAKMLMETFFPVPPEPQRERQTADRGNRDNRDHRNHRDDQDSQNTRSIQAPPTTPEITLTEIEYAIWSSSPEKAAGEDEITFAGIHPAPAPAAELAYSEDRSPAQTGQAELHAAEGIQAYITSPDH
ncbi:hypothetical protein KCU64_g5853, partial [Aureobasidium melanogenum]